MQIRNMKKGMSFMDFMFIKSNTAKTTANGKRYFNMSLSDDTFDVIEAKMWDVSESDEAQFTDGKLVKIKGTVQEYQGRLQVIVNKIRLAEPADGVNLDDYVETAPISSEDMFAELRETAGALTNEDLRTLTLAILDAKAEALAYFPAAKRFHHALKGGLLYHTATMLKIAKQLTPLYPFLNADLLYAGVILHDIGKVDEMLADETGAVSDYSPEGKLLGHIISEIVEIDRFGQQLGTDPEILLLLKHMILSHHYEAEYGSPKKPMFPEAELLHHIDIIDARMNTMERIEKSLAPGKFSENNWELDGVQIYHPILEK